MATTQHTGQSFEETELCQDNRNRRVGVLGQARDHNCATYGFRLNLVRYLSYKSHCKVPDKKTQKTCIHSISCSKRILSFSCSTQFVWYIAHSVPHHLLLASFHCWVKVWFLHMSHTHSFTDYKCPWSTLLSSELILHAPNNHESKYSKGIVIFMTTAHFQMAESNCDNK